MIKPHMMDVLSAINGVNGEHDSARSLVVQAVVRFRDF